MKQLFFTKIETQKNKNYTQINYHSNQTNYCSKAMWQRNYFTTKNKNNLDIDSYVTTNATKL